jgi:pilus assembly protein CpaE
METDIVTCGLKTNNEILGRHLEDIVSSLAGFKVQKGATSGPWDLLIVEVDNETDKDFEFARNALASDLTGNVFVTSPAADPRVIIEALKMGAKGFFQQPIDKSEVIASLLKIKEQKEGPRPGRSAKKGTLINLFGVKGGVGTTTVAVNLATSMLELEGVSSVALIDMNQHFGDVPLFLNIEHPVDWAEICKNIARLDATYLMSILFKHESGLYVLPGPIKTPTKHIVTAETMETLLHLMRGLFDYIIVDSGQSLDPISRSVLGVSDRVILVSVLSLTCLVNVKRFREIVSGIGHPPVEMIDIVVNRLIKKSVISLEEAETTLNKKVLWTIPNDYRITMSAINQGKTVSSVDSGAEMTVRFKGLAGLLSGKGEKKQEKRGFFGR